MAFHVKFSKNFSFKDDAKKIRAVQFRIVNESLDIMKREVQKEIPDGSGPVGAWPGDYATGNLKDAFTTKRPSRNARVMAGEFYLGREAGHAYIYGHAHEHGELIDGPLMRIKFNDGDIVWTTRVKIERKGFFHSRALPRASVKIERNIERIVRSTEI